MPAMADIASTSMMLMSSGSRSETGSRWMGKPQRYMPYERSPAIARQIAQEPISRRITETLAPAGVDR